MVKQTMIWGKGAFETPPGDLVWKTGHYGRFAKKNWAKKTDQDLIFESLRL